MFWNINHHVICLSITSIRHDNEEEGENVDLTEMERAPPLDKCPGHWIIRSSDRDRQGLVDRVINGTRTMRVMYDNDESVLEVEVPYDEEGLVWLKVDNDK